ncbi:MAG: hypothetical protein U5R31_00505 [Acidimicrobiia bacterium]|nr:hypothetical protein [Acidimicrobiia bacterium]
MQLPRARTPQPMVPKSEPSRVDRKNAAYRAVADFAAAQPLAIVGLDGNAWDDPIELHDTDPDHEQFEVTRFHLADATHGLRDAYRAWLDDHPDELDRIRRLRPDGQLAITYQRSSNNYPKVNRMDRIYTSPAFEVRAMGHEYADALGTGSDHALVSGRSRTAAVTRTRWEVKRLPCGPGALPPLGTSVAFGETPTNRTHRPR